MSLEQSTIVLYSIQSYSIMFYSTANAIRDTANAMCLKKYTYRQRNAPHRQRNAMCLSVCLCIHARVRACRCVCTKIFL